ncbi:Rhodanese-like domain-containing protein [Abortiporus biennis]|nr:Rhodanese-like domain-containing protein [Abortiporus biennis]
MIIPHLVRQRVFKSTLPVFIRSRSMSQFGDNCPYVLSPSQLRQLQLSEPKEIAILDASWHMPNSPRKPKPEFITKHLPHARYLDLDEVASPNELGLKHMMPTPDIFAKYCEQLGISPSSHVVIYDSLGIFSAPRALFMFRALGHNRSSILDGGLPAWEHHGCPTESGEMSSQDSNVSYPPPKFDETVIRDYYQMLQNATTNLNQQGIAEVVVDARPHGRFLGTDPEPRPGLPSGHIPYACSLPFTTFLKSNTYTPPNGGSPITYTSLRSNAELHEALREALGPERAQDVLSGKRNIVASCGSGMTAGVLWLGLKLLGVEKVGLYDESWTGYALRKESPIATGE